MNSLNSCPVCNEELVIREYQCSQCDITIRGTFGLGALSSLTLAQQEFVKIFMCAYGNIKEVEKKMNISYPTVKNKLAEIQRCLCVDSEERDRQDILKKLEFGDLSVEQALEQLKKL